MKNRILFRATFLVSLLVLINVIFPWRMAEACLSVKVKPTDINVTLPIAELQGLIQQLQDAGTQVVGEAGVQMRQSIDQLSGELQQRIDQIKNAGSDLINEAGGELTSVINNLITQARALLVQVNDMIKGDIECINYDLAQRINQIMDGAYAVIDKVDVTLKNAIDRIYAKATMLVDTTTNRVALVLDNTVQIIVKAIILVFCFILLFWLIRMIYSGKFPKNKIFAIGIPIVIVLIVGTGIFLLLNKSALPKLVGKQMPIPSWQNSCSLGDTYYNQFMSKLGGSYVVKDTAVRNIGKNAIEQLNWCLYASIGPEIGTETSKKISEINALLFPPAIPPIKIFFPINNPCSKGGSINPGWINNRNFLKYKLIYQLSQSKVFKEATPIDPETYKTKVNLYTDRKIVLNETAVSPVRKAKTPVNKIRPNVLEHLNKK
jgi:hypothetical protein